MKFGERIQNLFGKNNKEEVDYASLDMQKLVEQMDIKVNEFKKQTDKHTLSEFEKVKKAFSDKVDEMPIAERGKFSGPLSKIDLYLTTLKTQLSNPITAKLAGQFFDSYISQMQAAISEIAAAL